MSKCLIKNEKWLQLDFNIPIKKNNEVIYQPSTSRGRPRKTFFDLCERSERRQTEFLRKTTTNEELIWATKSNLYAEGKRTSANLLQVTEYSPRRAIKIRKINKKISE